MDCKSGGKETEGTSWSEMSRCSEPRDNEMTFAFLVASPRRMGRKRSSASVKTRSAHNKSYVIQIIVAPGLSCSALDAARRAVKALSAAYKRTEVNTIVEQRTAFRTPLELQDVSDESRWPRTADIQVRDHEERS